MQMLEKFNWGFNTCGDPHLENMLRESKELALEMCLSAECEVKPRWLSLCGTSGTGKTLLATDLLEIWRRWAGHELAYGVSGTFARRLPDRFLSWVKFLSRQRNGEWGEMDDLRTVPFLVIDDIGAEHDPSGFAKARLYELLDARLGRWTVITANLSLAQLAAIDVRISSRMVRGGSVVVDVNTKDYALRKQKLGVVV